jgi:hypothetical protein
MVKRFDPKALAALELVLDVYNSGDHQCITARSLLVRFCSLSSTVMAFILLCPCRTLRLRTHPASMLVTSLQQST